MQGSEAYILRKLISSWDSHKGDKKKSRVKMGG